MNKALTIMHRLKDLSRCKRILLRLRSQGCNHLHSLTLIFL
ncbi:hypothetical protein EVA_10075 [gut metagenome]|uniref:Uncharacterized protein n=1 Tax=gut metagenome TaxID=749906 RepID=J9GPB7_9ZZZZ